MLSLRAVNQFYGAQHTLWNVDLELQTGECACVLGAPGMGKTTLMKCITGQLPVQSGHILWQGASGPPEDLRSLPVGRGTHPGIGYLPQDWRLFSQLSVEENLHIALLAVSNGAQAVPAEIYDLFPELYPLRQKRSGELPADLQLRLAMARALVARPELLILDEPTLGAGQRLVNDISQLIQRLNRDFGITILLVEQRLSFIRRVADRFFLLHRGRNVAQGNIAQLDDRMADWLML
ncbi:ABC transporter ATP-binding protein [Entomohabitans teleogrylli]|uniref:ABC transporter ATP-binding protein n=1 Tax=Entomohabitans teleogrylli TaxID=1384589 RepID=UPI00073D6BEF|nr:ATP-binding cassette domain-containing protein [Entomohabitans teleogrylli]